MVGDTNTNNTNNTRESGTELGAKEIAARFVARGWKVIPIQSGEKGPKGNAWQTRTYNPQRDFEGKNIGVRLGPVSGGLTDVDLDCAEAIALAPDFLPRTGAIFGRQSKQRSHWLYITDDPDPSAASIKLIDQDKKSIIELRMSGGGKGAQTVFPGSTHPSGEKVEWADNGEPSKSSCAILKDRITKIAVGVLLARHWPVHGSRHEAALRCGGFLARAGWEPDTIKEFMDQVQTVAGVTNPSHIEDHCKTAYDAALGCRNGDKVYGFPAMVEMFGADVCKRLTALLHYREVDKEAALERLNERYCITPYGGKVRVLSFEHELNRTVMTFYSTADFKLRYDNIIAGYSETTNPSA